MNRQMSLFSLGLPEQHLDWSIRDIYKKVERLPEIVEHTTIDNRYEMNVISSMALQDLSKKPLKGRYRSLIFDTVEGLILCRQSSRQLINHLVATKCCGGFLFQTTAHDLLGLNEFHTISLGQAAFFAIHGYSRHNTCWLNLGLFKKAEINRKRQIITFSSVKIKSCVYKLTFKAKNLDIEKSLDDGIFYARTVARSFAHHMLHDKGIFTGQPGIISLLNDPKYELRRPASLIKFQTLIDASIRQHESNCENSLYKVARDKAVTPDYWLETIRLANRHFKIF